MGVLSVLEFQVANMWELHVEIEDCSATNLSHIATFELPSIKGGAHRHFINPLDLHAS